VSAHLDPQSLGSATGELRRVMLDHLRDCPICRAAVAAEDPVALFALLAEKRVPQRILDEVSAHVTRRAGLDRGSIGAILSSIPSTRLRLAAAVVAGIALVGVATTLRENPTISPVASATPAPRTAIAKRADVNVHPDRAVSQVVDFTVGDTQVVMVYNGDLKL